MEDWTRVVLYGTYDGFTLSTDGLHRIVVILEGGERVEVPKEFVSSADQMVNKNKIKLKDVIARIKSFDVDAREAWLNEILNELGSDYGALKYKAGYEQGKFDSAVERAGTMIPQIAADYIKYAKENGWDLQEAMDGIAYEDDNELRKWFNNNIDTFARAWLDGYTVVKEKRYTVKMRATKQPLFYNNMYEKIFFSLGELATRFTRKELEEAGFGWVFDCPGMEVEEVK